jgi:ABC-type lipoprotein export system ATPase subunit
MSLLELERVVKTVGRGPGQRSILRDISLQVDPGELVAIWGARRSGRSTLLRIAAGFTRPDEGVVRFQGEDLAGKAGDARRAGIAYCLTRHGSRESQVVLEQLVTDQVARGLGIEAAEKQARNALARTGGEPCAAARFNALDPAEAVRVALARALTQNPKLLLVDEPTLGVELSVRDEILRLLRSLADEGLAVLMTTGDAPCLSVADRKLSLDAGELHGNLSPRLARVVALRRSA